jgi:hypothetical protein
VSCAGSGLRARATHGVRSAVFDFPTRRLQGLVALGIATPGERTESQQVTARSFQCCRVYEASTYVLSIRPEQITDKELRRDFEWIHARLTSAHHTSWARP